MTSFDCSSIGFIFCAPPGKLDQAHSMIWPNVDDRNVVMLRCCRMGGHTMPFTQEQFFQVFATYNAAIHPSLRAAFVLGFTALGLLFWRSRISTVQIMAILALMWLVNGVAIIGHSSPASISPLESSARCSSSKRCYLLPLHLSHPASDWCPRMMSARPPVSHLPLTRSRRITV